MAGGLQGAGQTPGLAVEFPLDSSGSGGRQEGGEWDESTDAATSKGDEGDSYANDDGNDDIALLVRELQTLKLELELERTARKAQDEHIEAMQMEMNTKLNTRDLEENLDIILAMHQSRPQSRPQSTNRRHPPGKQSPKTENYECAQEDGDQHLGNLAQRIGACAKRHHKVPSAHNYKRPDNHGPVHTVLLCLFAQRIIKKYETN